MPGSGNDFLLIIVCGLYCVRYIFTASSASLLLHSYLFTSSRFISYQASSPLALAYASNNGCRYCLWFRMGTLAASHRLPLEYDKIEVDLTLLVVENKEQGYVQKLQVEPLSSSKWLAEQGMPNLRNLRVSLYRANESLLPGAVIDAKVMLRSPRNIENGLAFDYEAWLLSKKVDATGYIKEYTLVSYGSPTLRSQF